MAKKPKPVRDRIIDAALDLAAEKRWRDVSLGAIADHAGVSLSQLHGQFVSRGSIVSEIMHRADDAVVAGADPSAMDEPAHDRVLDALLRRFEALTPLKRAIGSILRDLPTDPLGLLCLAPKFYRSMTWTLESAGIGTSGIAGHLRVKGVSAIYAAALCVWLRDDSVDQARTMAFLDRRLQQAERLAALMPFGIVERRGAVPEET
jgi:AcrR family transcriptional regulator